jgi:hypothetical protein
MSNYYTRSFVVTAAAAWKAFCFCDRIGRRHWMTTKRFGWQVYNVASGDEAIALYKWLWGWCQVAWMVALVLTQMGLDRIDAYVAACEAQPEASTIVEPEPEPTEDDAPMLPALSPAPINWDDWKAADLRWLATRHSIPNGARLTKTTAIALLSDQFLSA